LLIATTTDHSTEPSQLQLVKQPDIMLTTTKLL
jgi:hypothetical protein